MDDFDYIPGIVPSPFVSSAAPKLTEYEFPEVQQEKRTIQKNVVRPAPKTQVNKLVMAITFITAAIILLIMSTILMHLNNSIVANNKKITTLQSQIEQAEAENVRLNAAVNAAVSADKIQEYAVSVLGMQKAERYQIHYFEDRDGDKVVIADGKALNADMQDE